MRCNATECNAAQRDTTQCQAMQCVQCNAVNTTQCMPFIALQGNAMPFDATGFDAMPCHVCMQSRTIATTMKKCKGKRKVETMKATLERLGWDLTNLEA